MNSRERTLATTVATGVTSHLLATDWSPDGPIGNALETGGPGNLHRAEVHQAIGILSVQLGLSIDQARARLRAHAFAAEQPITETARQIIAGSPVESLSDRS
ncbi:ANTAR domain-containing protein [Streptomyces sp. NPDC047043]|uniref:ANTAR domain-containing protein n=1 Tax=Streptomyces sp. NPDC047043 TaxID=3154497 RepID=UPI0033F0C45D